MQHLGWSLLYHQFERLWGLPSVAQSSQEDFCSFGPNSAYHGPSQVQIPISILPEAFPLSNELSNNVEHHHGKELIQHQWGLPGRIHESRALMRPPSDSSEISEPESNYGLSYISVYKGQSRKTLNVGSSPPRSFWERGSEMQHLEEDVGKDKGNSLENGPEGPLLGDSDSSSDEDLMDGSEEELDGPGVSLSDRLTDEALLTHTEDVSSVDVGASQGLPVHVEDRGVRMEQRQEPRGPRQVFRWCRKKILPARKRLSPQGPTSEGLGGGDPGWGTCQTRWKNVPTQDMALEEVLGSKSSQTTSQKGQSAPERPFRKQMRRLFPCLHPDREGKKQEHPQEAGSPVSRAQSRGPDPGRDALPGTTRDKRVRGGLGGTSGRSWGVGRQQTSPAPKSP
ncbi:hypothetical protein mRhiFer1_008796 [Rhinolophus ferrumequinum]|uniref:SPATA31 domain-containing protein n=1 Tax=Rhinolophus ferrumequinum TaxID=59479 RepID=A0A7J8AFC9_RHIFE|nr:hypothetical protein mRhiFer1_008796 [Rhinolophus ferrumequinum]